MTKTPVESVSKEKHLTGITARIDKDTSDKGLWLVIENDEDDDQNVSWPLQESEIAAVRDACEEYLRINQKE